MNQLGADGRIVASQLGHAVDVSLNMYNKVGFQTATASSASPRQPSLREVEQRLVP